MSCESFLGVKALEWLAALPSRNWRLLFPHSSRTLDLMLAKVYSCAVVGLDGAIVEVEVDMANGLPSFVAVGLDSPRHDRAYRTVGEAD
jgi:hypothetical protein